MVTTVNAPVRQVTTTVASTTPTTNAHSPTIPEDENAIADASTTPLDSTAAPGGKESWHAGVSWSLAFSLVIYVVLRILAL